MNSTIIAKPKTLIYEADDSQYKVIKAKTKSDEEIILVGFFPSLTFDLFYKFEGENTLNAKYGMQFKVSTYRREDINDKEGIIGYLSSGIIKGIGKKSAEKIFELLGVDAINKILENKDCLKEIKGFSFEKINTVYESLLMNKKIEEAYIELYSYGLTPNMVSKLYLSYGDNTINIIKENPYRLIYEVQGFGFSKADNLALSFGFSRHSKKRIEEGLIYTLYEVCNQKGFTFLNENQLINSAIQILNKGALEVDYINITEILESISVILKDNKFIKEDNRYYPLSLYESEVGFANDILRIKKYDKNKKYSTESIIENLKNIEYTYKISYTEMQKKAIINAVNNNISIICGGPGTGKTTIIKGIINLLAALEGKNIFDDGFRRSVLLCAPTGRAALRLGKECNLEASTIHRALG